MERVPVTSSNLASIGYDVESKVLEIEFRNGSVYRYFDVPQQIFDDLLAAPSRGRYFNTNIKGYRYKQLNAQEKVAEP